MRHNLSFFLCYDQNGLKWSSRDERHTNCVKLDPDGTDTQWTRDGAISRPSDVNVNSIKLQK